jgi:hypothetical protein
MGFLKKAVFDADKLTEEDNLLLIFGKAALESEERIKASKNKPNGCNLRRLVSEGVGSMNMHGRWARKAS